MPFIGGPIDDPGGWLAAAVLVVGMSAVLSLGVAVLMLRLMLPVYLLLVDHEKSARSDPSRRRPAKGRRTG